jgi:hypothetical protein
MESGEVVMAVRAQCDTQLLPAIEQRWSQPEMRFRSIENRHKILNDQPTINTVLGLNNILQA